MSENMSISDGTFSLGWLWAETLFLRPSGRCRCGRNFLPSCPAWSPNLSSCQSFPSEASKSFQVFNTSRLMLLSEQRLLRYQHQSPWQSTLAQSFCGATLDKHREHRDQRNIATLQLHLTHAQVLPAPAPTLAPVDQFGLNERLIHTCSKITVHQSNTASKCGYRSIIYINLQRNRILLNVPEGYPPSL